MAEDKKPSFLRSVISGIGGYIKGAIAGGAVGIAGGALVGVLLAAIGFSGGLAIPAAALVGATYGGGILAAIGSTAGTMTSVVKSREAAAPSANDIVNVAKATYAQGVAAGVAHEKEITLHRDRLAAERAMQGERQLS